MSLKCVIIDDSMFIRQTVTSLIEGAGHNIIETFSSGPSFLNALPELETPDVVFCDIILPEMTGLDLLNIISEGFPSTKIIMLSGVTHAEAISAALRLGAIDFLQKPVDKERLQVLLQKLSNTISAPSVEQLTTIGVGCMILTDFFDELSAHASSTLRKVIQQQINSILEDVASRTEDMFDIDLLHANISPNQNLWGTHAEETVLNELASIPQELQFELGFLYSDEFVKNLYDQAILTMASKQRLNKAFEKVPPETIGLPPLPELGSLDDASVTKAGTTYEDLDQSISIALFVFDEKGPSILTRLNQELLTDADLMKNSIFYYTLIDNDNFQEGLFGPLPVTSDLNNSLSSLAYTMQKQNEMDEDKVLILSIYFSPVAEGIVSDYNRLSFIIKTRLASIEYIHEIDKTTLRGLVDDIIDYLLE